METMICLRQADGKIIPVMPFQPGETRSLSCALAHEEQERIELRLFRLEASGAQEPVALGIFTMALPAGLKKSDYAITIIFAVDAAGQLMVTGRAPDGTDKSTVFTGPAQARALVKRNPFKLVFKTAAFFVYAVFILALVAFLACISFPAIGSVFGIKF